MGDAEIKFLLPSCDSITYSFDLSTTVGTMKEKILSEWPPKDTKYEAVDSKDSFRLIHHGKFLENSVKLQEITIPGGEIASVLHLHIRKTVAPASANKPAGDPPQKKSKGCCTIL
eukprot:TRINITY_DN2586_c0_g1_i1.p1 TRINITY_DN2586_c0_g1~~TRINITY_DN2586_c0_g1_i1.p1  ORF type:complete len:115 (-),score=5.43 TRINITY_DN2586_c0_g1_i1:25-369(-)